MDHENNKKLPSLPTKPTQRDSDNSPLMEVNITATKYSNSSYGNLKQNEMKTSSNANISTT